MQPGTRVKMSPMWKYGEAKGIVVKVNKDYVVVLWDGINGEWHYTEKQAERLEVINDQEECAGG